MNIKPEKYVRKPFAVEAIEVTPDNIRDVARWCGGKVKKASPGSEEWREHSPQYIKVDVLKPLNDRQTRAYYGDWVLSSGRGPGGFKVYTPQAFSSSFEKEVDRMFSVLERMEKRSAVEDDDDQEETLDLQPDRGVGVPFSNSAS